MNAAGEREAVEKTFGIANGIFFAMTSMNKKQEYYLLKSQIFFIFISLHQVLTPRTTTTTTTTKRKRRRRRRNKMSLCCGAAHKPTTVSLFSRASLAGERQPRRRSRLFLNFPPPPPPPSSPPLLLRASPPFFKQRNHASKSGSVMTTTTTTRAMLDLSTASSRHHHHHHHHYHHHRRSMMREGSVVDDYNMNKSSNIRRENSSSGSSGRRRRSSIVQRAAPASVDDAGNRSKNGNEENEEEKREAELKDVYQGPTRLAGGLRRHTILVYVADETGMINRVAGVFARRGYNIDSLCVGLNEDKAIFTIMVVSDDNSIAKLIKQLNKLAKVRKVENVTDKECVDRGLLLVKVKSDSSTRTELLEVIRIFRASVVDVSNHSITACVTGDPGKNRAFQSALSKFGVIQVARTGKLALKREPMYSESRSRKIKLMEALRKAKQVMDGTYIDSTSPSSSGFNSDDRAESLIASKIVRAVAGLDGDLNERFFSESSSSDLGVYGGDLDDEVKGVWDVPVLSSSYTGEINENQEDIPKQPIGSGTSDSGFTAHMLSIVVDNKPGVLDSITGVFARRGYNIQSLGVGPEATFDISRISTVVPGTQEDIRMLLKQILKVPYVISADDITKTPYVERELMLIKIVCDRKQRGELVDLCAIFRAKIVDVSENTATIEVGGRQKKITSIQRLLEPYGILEVARSGRVALPRDSGVDSKLLTAIENEGDLQW